MKILMLTPYLPYPPSDGGQVRSYNLIKRLAKKHAITLVCFTREHNQPHQVKHMEKYCTKVLIFERGKAWTIPNILRTGFSPYPFLVTIYYSPEIRKKLGEEIRNGDFDLIHAETFYAMSYLPQNNLPTVLVEQTIMSRVFSHYVETNPKWWLRPLLWIDVAKIKYWERHYWKKSDQLVAVSSEDRDIMEKALPGVNVKVVPNGVGDDFAGLPRSLHYNRTILYMGNYKWMQNWEAAEVLAKKVFPIIKASIPDAKLLISGQFMTKHIKDLETGGIEVSELEAANGRGVVEAYQKSGLLVAPIYGPGGTRLKILAAMAAMVPVVTTPLGAEGYGAQEGLSILVGKTPEELAYKAIAILKDKKLYATIAGNAKDLIEKKFSWDAITEELETIYRSVINGPKS